jgi:hypothetical protein
VAKGGHARAFNPTGERRARKQANRPHRGGPCGRLLVGRHRGGLAAETASCRKAKPRRHTHKG